MGSDTPKVMPGSDDRLSDEEIAALCPNYDRILPIQLSPSGDLYLTGTNAKLAQYMMNAIPRLLAERAAPVRLTEEIRTELLTLGDMAQQLLDTKKPYDAAVTAVLRRASRTRMTLLSSQPSERTKEA
jgi:hypothetical protein